MTRRWSSTSAPTTPSTLLRLRTSLAPRRHARPHCLERQRRHRVQAVHGHRLRRRAEPPLPRQLRHAFLGDAKERSMTSFAAFEASPKVPGSSEGSGNLLAQPPARGAGHRGSTLAADRLGAALRLHVRLGPALPGARAAPGRIPEPVVDRHQHSMRPAVGGMPFGQKRFAMPQRVLRPDPPAA